MEATLAKKSLSEDKVSIVTNASFKLNVLEGKGPIAVEFMSYSCSHCATIEPILQKVSSMLASKIKIFKVNTAIDQELSAAYQIEGTPTFIMFLNGREVGRIDGPSPKVSSLLTALAQPFRVRT